LSWLFPRRAKKSGRGSEKTLPLFLVTSLTAFSSIIALAFLPQTEALIIYDIGLWDLEIGVYKFKNIINLLINRRGRPEGGLAYI
jgi:hypothetical protein